MIPIRLEMKNFLAYRAPGPVLLEGVHLASLIGANGAGKTSLLDAITWALWGKARTRSDNDLIHLGATEMHVKLDFLHEGQRYCVVRRRTRRGRSGSGSLDLFIQADDGLNEIREGSMGDTQKRINKLLRLDYETFIHSAFLQQGNADSFTVQQPAKRKQILSNILGLEMWGVYEEQAKAQRDEYRNRVQAVDITIQNTDRDLAEEPARQRDLEDALAAQAEAQSALDTAEALLKEVDSAPKDLTAARDKKGDRVRRRDDHQRDLTETRTHIEGYHRQIADYEAVLSQRDEIEQGYGALQAARQASDDLNDKLRQLKGIDGQISDAQSTLNVERARLDAEQRTLTQQIEQYTATINRVDAAAAEALNAQVADLEAQAAQREQASKHRESIHTALADIKAENTALYATMTELRERIDTLSVVEGAECPLCGQALTDDHRTAMLATLQAEGESQGHTYRDNQQRKHDLEGQLAAAEATIKQLSDAVADLPRLQNRQGQLQQQQQAAAEAQIQLEAAQAGHVAVTQRLQHDDYAPEVREQLAALTSQKEALGYDEAAHDEQAEALRQHRRYEELRTQLAVADQSLPPLQEALQTQHAREERLTGAIKGIDDELITIEQEIGRLTVLEAEYNKRFKAVNELRTAWSSANEKVGYAKQELDSLAKKREKRKQDVKKRDEFAEQQGIYEELVTAFGKKGVPAMIIETVLPELQAMTNDILGRMTDGRMAVQFSTQKEKVTGGTSETLAISIADELGTRGYEMYSGGEAFRINFAIRVALSKLLARRAGAQLETLFIDEGFGTQDADGRTRLVEAINAIKDDFDLILVITHIDDLKDAFPVHIYVEKTPNGSTIDVQ